MSRSEFLMRFGMRERDFKNGRCLFESGRFSNIVAVMAYYHKLDTEESQFKILQDHVDLFPEILQLGYNVGDIINVWDDESGFVHLM